MLADHFGLQNSPQLSLMFKSLVGDASWQNCTGDRAGPKRKKIGSVFGNAYEGSGHFFGVNHLALEGLSQWVVVCSVADKANIKNSDVALWLLVLMELKKEYLLLIVAVSRI